MAVVAAVDQGTTGTRSLVVDESSAVLGEAYATHEQIYPRPGWVEHDPREIFECVLETLEEAVAAAGVSAADLAAIGVTNQRETTVLWEADSGDPVHNAIVWQDRRTTERVATLEGEWIRERTGLEPDAYFSASKLEWLLERVEDPRGLRAGTIDSWLIEQLTGVHVTDVTNASRTMLFDIHECAWDEELLETFGVPRSVLPTVRPSSDPTPYGHTDPDGPLGAAVPVTAAIGDQQAALFGQACFEPGSAKNTYGTGSFLLTNTGTDPVDSEHGLLTTVAMQCGADPVEYALEGSIFATGAAVEWLVDMGLLEDPGESGDMAATVDSTDGVYVVPAFTGLGAPHWDGRARGTVVGITRGTRPAHLVRATLEAVAFQTRDVLEAMEADADVDIDVLRVDGGAVSNDVLCSLQADLLGRTVERPRMTETTGLGTAYAAGLAVGVWEDRGEITASRRVDRHFEPSLDSETADSRHTRWREAVERSLGWARE